MTTFLQAPTLRHFFCDEDGAQVVEYALLIAVISLALILAIQGIGGGSLSDFIDRVSKCLQVGGTCA